MTIANSLEKRLELSFNFRTVSSDAIVMHASGSNDFHSIEVFFLSNKIFQCDFLHLIFLHVFKSCIILRLNEVIYSTAGTVVLVLV